MVITKQKKPNVIKIGLIGAGRWGKNIIKTSKKIPSIKLSCVASKNPDTRNLVKNDCKIFTDWRELISYSDLDGIIICTPPKTHFEIAQSSIEAGHPLLIEKPLTLDLEEAKTIYKLSTSHNKLVMTDFTQLFNEKFIALKESLKLIGDIKFLITKAGNYGPYREDIPVIWDWGAHELSILISILGCSPTKIISQKINEKENQYGDESIWNIRCSFDNQIESSTLIGNMMPRCRKIGILGTNGMIVLDDIGKIPLSFYKDWNRKEFPTQEGIAIEVKINKEPLAIVIESFLNLIKKGINKHWSLSMGIEVTRLLHLC